MVLNNILRQFLVLCSVSSQERGSVFKLFKTYQQLSVHTSSFQSKTKLGCKSGCGKCCENPQIHTTVFEMIPIATELMRLGRGEELRALAIERKLEGPCVFYQKDTHTEGNGRCSIYLFRPLICRLFGFSVKKDKNQKQQIVTCQTIKSICAKELQRVDADQRLLKAAPDVQEYSMKAYSLNPTLGKDQVPINEAFKIALERVGLFKELSS